MINVKCRSWKLEIGNWKSEVAFLATDFGLRTSDFFASVADSEVVVAEEWGYKIVLEEETNSKQLILIQT